MAALAYQAVGRRKKSIARVRLVPGEGKILINNRDIENYFGLETLKMTVRQPLVLTDTGARFDVLVNVYGGGTTGQAGAIRHGIARALCKADAELRPSLKKAGFLTRDPRMKERKKYGLKAARRAPPVLQALISHLFAPLGKGFLPGAFFYARLTGRSGRGYTGNRLPLLRRADGKGRKQDESHYDESADRPVAARGAAGGYFE